MVVRLLIFVLSASIVLHNVQAVAEFTNYEVAENREYTLAEKREVEVKRQHSTVNILIPSDLEILPLAYSYSVDPFFQEDIYIKIRCLLL